MSSRSGTQQNPPAKKMAHFPRLDTQAAESSVYAPAEHATTSKHKTLEEGEKLEDAGKDEPPSWSQKGGN
ncbi:hypothetical protein FRC07_005880 [Ceratobasidium sp. 392]|nr:hypothetical protein FRC07_005880 [Ceratobasidium sp. 392]